MHSPNRSISSASTVSCSDISTPNANDHTQDQDQHPKDAPDPNRDPAGDPDGNASPSLSSCTNNSQPTQSGTPLELICSCGTTVGDQVRQWTSTLSAGAQSCGQRHKAELPPMIIMVLQLRQFSWISKYMTFYRMHAMYFLTVGSFGTLLMYVIPLSDSKRLDFIDAVFTAFSAACGTGLQSVRSPDLTQVHYLVILVLLNLGAPVLISLMPLYARTFYFHICARQCRNQQNSCSGQLQQQELQQPQQQPHDEHQLQCRGLSTTFCFDCEVLPCSSNINGLSSSVSSRSRAADPKVGFKHHLDDLEMAMALLQAQACQACGSRCPTTMCVKPL